MDFFEVTKTATFRQSVITMASTFINGALGAAFYFLLARFLGSGNFGVFTIATTTITLVYGIVDLGCDQGLVRFIPKYKNDPLKQKQIMKLALSLKGILGTLALFIFLLGTGFFSRTILKQPLLEPVIPLIGLGVLSQLLFSFSTSSSQALEKYYLWGGLFIGTNLLRLLLLVVLYYANGLTNYSSLVLYIVMPILGFIFSFSFFDKSFLLVKNSFSNLKELFGFNKWVTAFIIVATIGSRLDIYFSARYLSLSEVGVYGLALQLVSFLPQITSAIGAVTSPKFASFNSNVKNLTYTLKATLLNSGLAILSTILIIPAAILIFKFTGKDFTNAMTPFLLLLISMDLFLINAPVRDSLLYYFGKPQFFFWQGLSHIVIVSIASIFLIPTLRLPGVAIVVLIGEIFIVLSATWYYLHLDKNE